MKKMILLLLFTILTACGQSETPQEANIPTVEELASDPMRLKELRQQCRMERTNLGDVLCNRVAEATRKTVLWRWHDAIYTIGESAQDVLTV